MKQRKLNLLGIVWILSFLLPTLSNAQSDKKSVEILKKVSAKYKSLTSIKAEFYIMQESPNGKAGEKQKGSIILKNKKYKLDIAGQEIVNDGTTNWSFLKEVNEIQISEAGNDENAINPANIFTLYEKGFHSKFIDEKKDNNRMLLNLELMPTDKNKKYFKIKLSIDKIENLVVSARIFDKNGSHYVYSIEKFTPNFPAPDNLFTMDAKSHPKAEIIDLR